MLRILDGSVSKRLNPSGVNGKANGVGHRVAGADAEVPAILC